MFSAKTGSARIQAALSGFEATIAELEQGAQEAIVHAEARIAAAERVAALQLKVTEWVLAQLRKLETRAAAYAAKQQAAAQAAKADAKRAQAVQGRLAAVISGKRA